MREVARKGGRAFEVRWVESGNARQRTFTVKSKARAFAAQMSVAVASGTPTEGHTRAGRTVAEVVAASLAASRPRLKASTYAGLVALYDRRVLPAFGDARIAAVTSEQIEAWVAGLVAEGRAASTVRNHYVALHKVFRYALRHRIIAHDPCAAVEVPRPGNRESFTPVFLSPAQVETIAAELDATAPPLGTLVRFAAWTGLRAAEIAGLRVRDVNLAAGHVEVRQTIRRVDGKWHTDVPKSSRSTRTVPLLSRTLIAELRRYLVTHPMSGDPDALFWPARANGSRRLEWGRPIDLSGVRGYYLVPAARRLGVVEHMRFHDLRHTFASIALAAGFKPYEVSRWMGHASVTTTDAVYGHLYPVDYEQQIDRFEAFVTGEARHG